MCNWKSLVQEQFKNIILVLENSMNVFYTFQA